MNWVAIFALVLFAAFLDGRVAATEEYLIAAEAQRHAAEEQARMQAALLAPCLNGDVILTVSDEPVAECRRLRRR
jgi:hypothetical protein